MQGMKKRHLLFMVILGVLTSQVIACASVIKEQVNDQKYETGAKKEEVEVSKISDGNYAYENLGQEEQQVYDEILSTILNHQEKMMLSSMDTEVMRKAYTAVCADYGGLFWVNGYVFTKYMQGDEQVGLEFAPSYTMTEEERQQIQQQIDKVVEQWLGNISITDTDYAKVKYIYELLSTNTEYAEEAPNSQNIISVFLNGQTVCQGYACAAQYLLKQLGIQSVIVSGTALGEAHAWNLFQLNGAYYYMDVTWGRGKYVEDTVENYFVDYKYMTMTTEEMLQEHIPEGELNLPECTAVADNYYRKEGAYIEEWNTETIGAYFTQAYEEKQMVSVRFANSQLYDKAINYFFEEGNVAQYCPDVQEINYITEEDWLEISFYFSE